MSEKCIKCADDLRQLSEEIAKLKHELEKTLNTVSELTEDKSTLRQRIDEMQEDYAKLQVECAKHKAHALRFAANNLPPVKTLNAFEYNGKKYQFIIPSFNLSGTIYKAAEAAVSDEILEKLFSISTEGILKEI